MFHPIFAAFLWLANVAAAFTITGAKVPYKVTDTVLTTAEAGKRMGLTQITVLAYIERGLIKAKKLGPIWLITAAECERYNRERKPRGNPRLQKSA